MRIIVNDNRATQWVLAMTGHEDDAQYDASLVLTGDDGEYKAGAVFTGWVVNPNGQPSCNFHGCVETRLTRSFIKAVFDYAYNTLDVALLLSTVAGDNTKSLRVTQHLGFTQIGIFPGGKDYHDVVLSVMAHENCRYL